MIYRLAALFLSISNFAFAQICEPPSKPLDCGSHEFQACAIKVQEQERRYCQHVPNQGGDLPVIFSFHGAGGKSKALVNLWRGQTEQSMVLVVPEALLTREGGECSQRWRQIGTPADTWKELDTVDSCDGGNWSADLEFVDALLTKIKAERQTSRFYALGFSNGGGFVFQLYLTKELASQFSGFAAAGAGMTGAKLKASKEKFEYATQFSLNKTIKRPFLFQIGTEDKKNVALEVIAKAVDENPACQPVTSAAQVMQCFYFTHLDKRFGAFDMPTRRSLTRNWLVQFNNADARRHESLYPNLGVGPSPSDETMTLREDYFAKAETDSKAVSVLTTVDGGHDWPGWGGNRAPCPSRNCDVDLLHEILQFWRAHGEMKLPVP